MENEQVKQATAPGWVEPGGDIDPVPSLAHAFKVEVPAFFDMPKVVDLFERAFTGENAKFDADPEEMRRYLRDHITDPGDSNGIPLRHWLNFWVAYHDDPGFCGFIVLTYAPWPMCPNLCAAHFHVEHRAARRPLLDKSLAWALKNGLTRISLINQSPVSDRGYLRITERYGKARVKGSHITCDLEPWQ